MILRQILASAVMSYWHCLSNAYFTPTQDKTRQNCLVLSCSCRWCELNWRQVKTVFSSHQYIWD